MVPSPAVIEPESTTSTGTSPATNDAALWEEPFRSKAQVNALVSLLERREESPIARFMTEDRTLARMQLMFRDATGHND